MFLPMIRFLGVASVVMIRFLGVASSRSSLCCIGQIIWSAFCKNIINELFSFSVNFHCNSPNFLLHQLITQKSISIESKQFGVCRFFALRAIHIVSAIITQPITQIDRLCIHPNTRIIFLQILSIKGSRVLFPFECFQNVSIARNTSAYFERSLPCRRPFVEFRTPYSYWQNQFSN